MFGQIVNAKPDSCLEEKNCKKLSLHLNTANIKQDRSSYIQCAILPEADKYPQAVKVIADIFQQYNIPLLLQASLQKKYGPEVFAKEGTAMWHALGEKLVDKNSPAGKNSSTLMQGQTRIQSDWQPSVTRIQTPRNPCMINTRIRATMHRRPRSWQTMRLSMVRRGQRTMLPTM